MNRQTSEYLLQVTVSSEALFDTVKADIIKSDPKGFSVKDEERPSNRFFLAVHMDTENTKIYPSEEPVSIMPYKKIAQDACGDNAEVKPISDYSFY